jgi:ribosome maturation factor RimP
VPAASSDRVRDVVAPVVEAAGLDLEDLSVSSAGRRRLLRVAVERDGGVSLDDVALVSQRISDVLDATDVMGGQPYVLEVGSPGVDRPLTEPRHWQRATGRLVAGTLRDGASFDGRVLTTDGTAVVLGSGDGDRRTVALADVATARVQVEFTRAADAGTDGDDDDGSGTGREED